MRRLVLNLCLVISLLVSFSSCTTPRLAQVHGKGVVLDSKKFADLGIVPKGVLSEIDGYSIDILTLLEEETDERLSDDMEDIADGTSINIADLLEEMGIHEDTEKADTKPAETKPAETKPTEPKPTNKPAEPKPEEVKKQGVKISCDNVWLVQLKEWADSWLGVPYLFGGTTRKGIDCSAFTGTLYKNVFDVVLQRNSRAQYSQDCYETVKQANLQLGDLVFFITNGKPSKSTNISHVGVYVGDNIFVHSSTSKGVVYSRLTDSYWVKTFLIGGRVLKFN